MAHAEVEVTGDSLTIYVRGVDKILAFKSHLEIPLAHITKVEKLTTEDRQALGISLKMPGARLPGGLVIGSFYQLDGDTWTFWDVHTPAHGIMIYTKDEKYTRIIIETDDQDSTLAQIRAAI